MGSHRRTLRCDRSPIKEYRETLCACRYGTGPHADEPSIWEASMTSTSLHQQLLELETQYWRAIKDKDVEAALQLTDDACTIVGASGAASIDARTFTQMLQGAQWELLDFTID